MTVSSERLVSELEKIFLSEKPLVSLEEFAHIPGLPFELEHFPLFQRYAHGNIAFLWAGYLFNYGDRSQTDEIMGRLRLPMARRLEITFYLSFKDKMGDLSSVFSPYVEEALRFQFVLRMIAVRNYKAKFGPYISANHKVKALGFGGEYWVDRGFEGKTIGRLLQLMEEYALRNPMASLAEFKTQAEHLALDAQGRVTLF